MCQILYWKCKQLYLFKIRYVVALRNYYVINTLHIQNNYSNPGRRRGADKSACEICYVN